MTERVTDQGTPRTVRANGIDMSVRVRGDGPPLLLVAGTGYPGSTWPDGFVDPLTETATVITYDHRGTGRSTSTGGAYSTRLFAEDATALLEALGMAPAHVLGHSMGGRVAQWMALDAPGSVASLILAASGPGQYDPGRPLTRGIPVTTAEQLIRLGYGRYMATHIRDTFFTAEFAEAQPEVVEDLVDAFWRERPSLRDYLAHITARQQHQTAELLSSIPMPALVLVGDHDTGARGTGSHLEQSRYLAEHLPEARLEVMSDTSHGYIWQTPARTAEIVAAWIRERSGD